MFKGNKVDNLDLFQKVILDVACVSTCAFFVQNEIYPDAQGDEETTNDHYLWNTFEFFQDLLIRKLYPVTSADSNYESMTLAEKDVWTSLSEALAILYHYYPLKTGAFLDRVSKHYKDHKAHARYEDILQLKNGLNNITKNKFNKLCKAGKSKEEYTIAKFIENYKNVLAFADLANNVLIAFPIVTETLVMWGEKSFLKNIDDYEKNPENFIKQTLKELFSILKMSETETKFAKVKEALETNVK
jgi:hypothetical protein